MNNMLTTITPKSDQINFDDFTGGYTKTIKITNVSILAGDQPVAIHYEGENGKPWKPSKGMRRVLVNIWGADASKYVGRSLTLYGDPKVTFGAAAVGGIRISHMSHITEPVTMALTASKASRKPFTVKPLVMVDDSAALKARLTLAANQGEEVLAAAWKQLTAAEQKTAVNFKDELKKLAASVVDDGEIKGEVI